MRFLFLLTTLSCLAIEPDVIRITNSASAHQLRTNLIWEIWGTSVLPKGQIQDHYSNLDFTGTNYNGYYSFLTNWPLSRLDIVKYEMPVSSPNEGVIPSYIWRLTPNQTNGSLFIYHEGHGNDGWWGRMYPNRDNSTIVNPARRLLEKGYTVLCMSMPLQDVGGMPVVMTKTNQYWFDQANPHNSLYKLETNALRFFFEKIPVSIDWACESNKYSSIHMMGLSGGGWTTTWYAAIDPRITTSYEVAGSAPISLRIGYEGLGDVEQTDDTIYQQVCYSELYTLGTYPNRLHWQILNRFDDCCFWGERHTNWVDQVNSTSHRLSREGCYRFRLDKELNYHGISEGTMQLILDQAEDWAHHCNPDPHVLYAVPRLRIPVTRKPYIDRWNR